MHDKSDRLGRASDREASYILAFLMNVINGCCVLTVAVLLSQRLLRAAILLTSVGAASLIAVVTVLMFRGMLT